MFDPASLILLLLKMLTQMFFHLVEQIMARIQLQWEVFSPRVLSLVMSFEGTMVLNAEL